MATPNRNLPIEIEPTAARQGHNARPVLKVLIVSLVLAGIAAIGLSLAFNF